MHSTDNIDDGYVGSGLRLWRSIKKHGKENHKVEILEYLPTRHALALREEELVNKVLLKDPLCMNLITGGRGDWGWSSRANSANRIQRLSEIWDIPGYRENFKDKTVGRKRSIETKTKLKSKWTPQRRLAQAGRLRAQTAARFKDYWLTHETQREKLERIRIEQGYQPPDRKAISILTWAKIKTDDEKMSVIKGAMSSAKLGKIWIHQNSIVKLILPEQEQLYLSKGWVRGTGNRQKVKEVSAETRIKLSEAAKRQHQRAKNLNGGSFVIHQQAIYLDDEDH
jgi:hypothetical protein